MDAPVTPAAPKTCAYCNLKHMNPCADETRRDACLIYQAQQAAHKDPEVKKVLSAYMDIANPAPDAAPSIQAPSITMTIPPLPVAPVAAPVEAPAPGPVAAPVTAPIAHPQVIADAETAADAVNPSYYSRFKIQPIVFIRENNLPFWSANVVKYVCRADAKNGLEDIEKAINYLLKERAYLKGDANWMTASL